MTRFARTCEGTYYPVTSRLNMGEWQHRRRVAAALSAAPIVSHWGFEWAMRQLAVRVWK